LKQVSDSTRPTEVEETRRISKNGWKKAKEEEKENNLHIVCSSN